MYKKFNFGKHNYNNTGRRYEFIVEVRLSDDEVFSACGTIGRRCGGQCLDDMLEFLKDDEVFVKIYNYWKKYHLNNMHAGTIKQEDAIKEYLNGGKRYDYAEVCKYLDGVGLLVDDGYRYGSKWLKRDIPENDLKGIKELLRGVKYALL